MYRGVSPFGRDRSLGPNTLLIHQVSHLPVCEASKGFAEGAQQARNALTEFAPTTTRNCVSYCKQIIIRAHFYGEPFFITDAVLCRRKTDPHPETRIPTPPPGFGRVGLACYSFSRRGFLCNRTTTPKLSKLSVCAFTRVPSTQGSSSRRPMTCLASIRKTHRSQDQLPLSR